MDERTDTPAVIENIQAIDSVQDSDIDEIILGDDATVQGDRAFAVPEEKAVVTDSTPERPMEPGTPPQSGNEEVRYEYWQSQHDKLKNDYDSLQGQFQTTQQQLSQVLQNQGGTQQQAQQEQEPAREEFPPAPGKPKKPSGFSREEAYTDSSSESAKYLDDVESWRDDMDEYNSLHMEYATASMQVENEAIRRKQVEDIQRREAEQQYSQQLDSVANQVKSSYNVNDSVAQDFVSKMSDPNSLTIDNLWRLYTLDNNLETPPPPPAAPPQAQPSPDFQQAKRAQQVPSPMGVLPSQNVGVDSKTDSDRIMDSIIKDYEDTNPWT